jgi:hypothetical protein
MARTMILATCAALLLATPALAATPQAGKRYSGPTSQGKKVALRAGTGDEAKTVRTFFIRWSVRCPAGKSTFTYRAQAKLERLTLGPRGGFTGKVFYQDSNLGKGFSANVFVRLAGRFTSSSLASGKWRGAVRLFKNGDQVAYCRSSLISWRAALEQ